MLQGRQASRRQPGIITGRRFSFVPEQRFSGRQNQGPFQNLVHIVHRLDLQILENLGRDFGQVAFVLLGNQDAPNVAPLGGQQLFGQAADGQDPARAG
jgi:hypothetical protein